MSKPLDEVYVEIKARTDKLDKSFNKLKKDFKNTEKESEKTSKKVSQSFKAIGSAIVAAFSIRVITQFTKKVVNLASEAEGVRTAFNKIADSNLLDNLNKAVRGTVSEVELMKQAVRAENFKIPLEKLATFFDFATQRALQTGESVDYLVDSIINGIGRKSTLVMDNLGISAAELQEEVKKVGDFGLAAGNIIQRELEKSGNVADTTQTTIKQLSTQFENLSVVIGQVAIKVGGDIVKYFGFDSLPQFLRTMTAGIKEFFGIEQELSGTKINDFVSTFEGLTQELRSTRAKELTDEITDLTLALSDKSVKRSSEQWRELNLRAEQAEAQLGALVKIQTEVDKGLRDQSGNLIKVNKEFNAEKATVGEVAERIKQLNEDMINMKVGSKELQNARKEIEKLQELLDGKINEDIKSGSIAGLNKQLNELTDKIKKTDDPTLINSYIQQSIILEDKLKQIEALIERNRKAFDPTAGVGEAPTGELADIEVDDSLKQIDELAQVWDVLEMSANRAGDAMARGLTDAIFKGENLISVLGETLKMFAQIAVQSALTSAIGTVTGGGLLGLIGGLFSSAAPDGGGGGNGLQAVTSAVNQVNGSIQNLTLQSLRQGTRPQVNNIYMDSKLVSNAIKSADNTFQGNSVDRTQI